MMRMLLVALLASVYGCSETFPIYPAPREFRAENYPRPGPYSNLVGEPVNGLGIRFPQQHLSRGEEGWVALEFTLNIDGTVSDIRIIDSSPKQKKKFFQRKHSAFERNALEAAREWVFHPVKIDGEPVIVKNIHKLLNYEIKFPPKDA